MCNSLHANCNLVSSAEKSVLPVRNHWNSVSLTQMHTVSCHSHLTWGLKALTEFCASDTRFQWHLKMAILEKFYQVFPDFLQKIFRYRFAYLTKTGVAFFHRIFHFHVCWLHKACHSLKKKWWVALNLAFCQVSQTLSYSSTVQLSMQDGKQRHRTQNIDGMYFPTSFNWRWF